MPDIDMDVLSVPVPPCQKSSPGAKMPPFPLLLGEHPLLLSPTLQGHSMVTNFRLCVAERRAFFSVPLLIVGELSVLEAQFMIRLGCKDGATYCITFGSMADYRACHSTLRDLVGFPPRRMQDMFAFRFFAAGQKEVAESQIEAEQMALCKPVNPTFAYSFGKEVERLGFDTSRRRLWRMSHANEAYEFCLTYPKLHLLPFKVSDEKLKESLDFRALKRFPSVVWRDKSSGMVLIRSSQPLSSILGMSYFRNDADLLLLDEIVKACNRDYEYIMEKRQSQLAPLPLSEPVGNLSCHAQGDNAVCVDEEGAQGGLIEKGGEASTGVETNGNQINGPSQLAIVDCRSTAGVWGNSFKGGGTEDEFLYKCKLIHLDIANIHAVRDSFKKLRDVCHNYTEGIYLKSLAASQWLQYISQLLRGANIVVDLMKCRRRPVLVHCSDGWDRTAQICSLSELLMDPYYRTMQGFQVLVEREWLHFGHKFGERGGHDPKCSDSNQNSPIFLQFLDCVQQLTLQYPSEFEFNEAYLIKLLKHSQACLFGTFLHNCSRERDPYRHKLASVWIMLHSRNTRFLNLLYKPKQEVLLARFGEHEVEVWKSVYMEGHMTQTSHTEVFQEGPHAADSNPAAEPLHRTRSMEELHKANADGARRNSDPSVNPGLESGAAADQHDTSSSSVEVLHCPDDSPKDSHSHAPALDYVAAPSKDISNLSLVNVSNGKEGLPLNGQENNISEHLESSISHSNAKEECDTLKKSHSLSQKSDFPTFNANYENGIKKQGCTDDKSLRKNANDFSNTANPMSLLSERLAESELPCQVNGHHFNRQHHSFDSYELKIALDSSKQPFVNCDNLKKDNIYSLTSKSLTENYFKQLSCDDIPTRMTSSEANLGLSLKIPPFQHTPKENKGKLDSNGILNKIEDSESKDHLLETMESSQSTKSEMCLTSSTSSSTTLCFNTVTPPHKSCSLLSTPPVTSSLVKKEQITSEQSEGFSGHKLLSRRARAASGASRDLSISPNTGNGNWTDTGRLRHASGSDQVLKRCISTAVSTSTTDISDSSVGTVMVPITDRYPTSVRQHIDVDGLTLTFELRQELLSQLLQTKDQKIMELEQMLHRATELIRRQRHLQTSPQMMAVEDLQSDSEGGEPSSLGALSNPSLESWEPIDETEAKVVPWVPDHIVTHCAGCDSSFWIGRWKHHCRNCGKVFCDECSNYRAPVPHAHLNKPERVCHRCHSVLMQLSPGASSDGRIPTLVADG